jgi:formate/nitrite transporter FocA (FNT family)
MQKYVRMLMLAILGGAAIGIGGIIYLSLDQKIVGALMFTAGLYSICVHGLNLFTGKVGYLVEQSPSYLVDLFVIWVGNLAGTWLAAMGARTSRISAISEKAATMCEVKVNDNLLSLLILGIFCGALMYIAVEGYKQTKNPIILFVGVATFILCGFEHCIADMFYLSVAGMWSGRAFLCILVISLGNALGAFLIPLAKKLPEN